VEILVFLVVAILLLVLTYKMSEKRGRATIIHMVIALFLSPLIPIFYLLVVGKTKEKQADDIIAVNKLVEERK